MYNQNQQEPISGVWDADGNENHERTDDLDGAAEGDNDTSRVSTVVNSHQTAPPSSRPRSRRDSFRGSDRDRDIRDDRDRDREYYATSRNLSRSHAGYDRDGRDGESRRRRTDSYMDREQDRGRGGDDYRDDYRSGRRHNMSASSNTNSLPRNPPADRGMYPDPYYHHMGAYNMRGGYPMTMPSTPYNPQREYLARLRVEYPALYREWYAQFQAYKNNPHQVPCPPIPTMPITGPMMGPAHGLGMPYAPMTPNPYLPHNQSSGHFDMNTSGYERHDIHSDKGRSPGRSSVELNRYNPTNMAGYYPSPQTPSINQDHDSSHGFKPIGYDGPSETETSPPPRRMTPLKYTIPHCIGSITPLGKLLKIKSGGTSIEIIDIKPLMKNLPEYKEVEIFPGPLVKGTTHKNNVIQFCQRKIKEAQLNEAQLDRESFILLWEYLILLLRQNGNVVGTDIAELLLKNTSSTDEANTNKAGDGVVEEGQKISENRNELGNSNSEEDEIVGDLEDITKKEKSVGGTLNKILPINEDKITEKFCQLLLYGHKKDALEYAMKNALWGHAILLASKMDDRTYGHVMARFANCTPYNHPLQTLYQIMSGKQPSSVTSCCDDSFGDWRPHLAMILSNAGARLDVESKAVITLGDTLASRNHVYAAQFCHLMGEVEFSIHSKLGPLLGLNSSASNVTEATQMTEIFEFARSLSQPNSTLGPSFIKSKLNYARTILGLGFVTEAYAYCEEITKNIQNMDKSKASVDETDTLKWSVLQIAERLVRCENTTEDLTEEPKWIQSLRSLSISGGSRQTESISDNNSERRDSVPDTLSVPENFSRMNSVGEKTEGQELNSQYPQLNDTSNINTTLSLSNINNQIPEYGHEHTQVQNIIPSEQQQLPPNQTYQPQDGPQSNLPYTLQQPNQPPPLTYNVNTHGSSNPNDIYQHQQQQQPPQAQPNNLGDNISNQPNSIHDLQQQQLYGSVHHDQSNNAYGIQDQTMFNPNQGLVDGYQTTSNYPVNNENNNYIPPGAYNLPPLTGGPMGGHGANKKKSVRFQEVERNEPEENFDFVNSPEEDDGDEEEEDENYDEKEIEERRLENERQRLLMEQLGLLGKPTENDEFDFCHPIKASVRNNYVGYKNDKPKIDSFNYTRERSTTAIKRSIHGRGRGTTTEDGGINLPLSSDEIMEEIDRLAFSSSQRHHQHRNDSSVTMGGTFPIDEPISAYPKSYGSSSNCRPSNLNLGGDMRHKRTFPIDKHCCNENELCEDHDNFYNGITPDASSTTATTTNSTSSFNSSLQNDSYSNTAGRQSISTSKLNLPNQNSTYAHGGGSEPNYLNTDGNINVTGAGPNSFAGKGFDNIQQPNVYDQPISYPNPPPLNDGNKSNATQQQQQKQSQQNPKGNQKAKGGGGGDGKQSKGWFGGILSKFKPPNQMILPDDKDPAIVWDDSKKRWVNTKGDEDDDSGPKGPPPKDSDLMGGQRPPMMMMQNPQQQQHPMMQQPPLLQQQPQMVQQPIPSQPSSFQPNVQQQQPLGGGMSSAPAQNVPFYAPQSQNPSGENTYQPQNPQNFDDSNYQSNPQFNQAPSMSNSAGPNLTTISNNKYKLPKGRNIRSGYVDILNPNSTTGSVGNPAQNNRLTNGGNMNGGPGMTPMPNMFIPQATMGSGDSGGPVNFLTPAPAIPILNGQPGQPETTN